MSRDSVVFYKSFAKGLEPFPDDVKGRVYSAAILYATEGIEPELDAIEMGLFEFIRPQIDANNERYENGCKGGAPVGNQNARKKNTDNQNNQKQPTVDFQNNQKQPNDNDNDNDNDKDKDKDIEDAPAGATSEQVGLIISHLNEVVGSSFSKKSKSTIKHINARLKDGFTVEDFYTVIDKKAAEWLHSEKMAPYLRPDTLFGTKFEQYLNQPEGKKSSFHNFTERRHDFKVLEAALINQ